jgi:hypothetical protein
MAFDDRVVRQIAGVSFRYSPRTSWEHVGKSPGMGGRFKAILLPPHCGGLFVEQLMGDSSALASIRFAAKGAARIPTVWPSACQPVEPCAGIELLVHRQAIMLLMMI